MTFPCAAFINAKVRAVGLWPASGHTGSLGRTGMPGRHDDGAGKNLFFVCGEIFYDLLYIYFLR